MFGNDAHAHPPPGRKKTLRGLVVGSLVDISTRHQRSGFAPNPDVWPLEWHLPQVSIYHKQSWPVLTESPNVGDDCFI